MYPASSMDNVASMAEKLYATEDPFSKVTVFSRQVSRRATTK